VAVAVVDGVATLTVSNLAVTGQSGVVLRAKYSGDARSKYAEQDLSHIVNKATVVISNIVAAPDVSTYGQHVTIQAELSVAAPGSATISGVARLYRVLPDDSAALLESASVSVIAGATTVTFAQTLPAGNNALRVKYDGSDDLAAAQSAVIALIVNKGIGCKWFNASCFSTVSLKRCIADACVCSAFCHYHRHRCQPKPVWSSSDPICKRPKLVLYRGVCIWSGYNKHISENNRHGRAAVWYSFPHCKPSRSSCGIYPVGSTL